MSLRVGPARVSRGPARVSFGGLRPCKGGRGGEEKATAVPSSQPLSSPARLPARTPPPLLWDPDGLPGSSVLRGTWDLNPVSTQEKPGTFHSGKTWLVPGCGRLALAGGLCQPSGRCGARAHTPRKGPQRLSLTDLTGESFKTPPGPPGWLSRRNLRLLISGMRVPAPCWVWRLLKKNFFFNLKLT